MLSKRQMVEFRIVSSCVVVRPHVAFVQAYLSAKNFSHVGVKTVFELLVANPEADVQDLEERVRPLRREGVLSRVEFHQLFTLAVPSERVAFDCLVLLELCFRDEAVRILKSNRDSVLVPLAPLEQDIANPSHETWSIITAAANYCADAGLREIADELSALLALMGEKALKLKGERQISYLVRGLQAFAEENPILLKPFVNELNSIAHAAAR